MICNIKDLREFIKDLPDNAYIGKYSLAGKPYMVIITEGQNNYTIKHIDCPQINMYSTEDMLKQLKDKSS